MTLRLNKNFYKEESVKTAIARFKEITEITYEESGEYYEIKAESYAGNKEELMKEFANHCLAENR